jgi:uncharacterized membrane protein
MSDQPFDTSNVLVVSFDVDDNAYAALTELKELDSQDQIEVRAAGVVVRQERSRTKSAMIRSRGRRRAASSAC